MNQNHNQNNKVRKVEVIPYQEDWKEKFENEAELIKMILKSEIIDIYHIGSTSIPNMSAKPIIDIMVSVHSIDDIDQFNQQFRESGYIPMGEHGIPLRRFFYKEENGIRVAHIHIFDQKSADIERHLNFRDYMITHPIEALQYSQLKETLAKKYPTDMESYIQGKHDFIQEMDRKAAEWKKAVER